MIRSFGILSLVLVIWEPAVAQDPEPPQPLEIRVAERGWGNASVADISKVLRSVASEFRGHVPKRPIPRIEVRYSTRGPMTLYRKSPNDTIHVLLNVRGTFWAQFSFQFAHELGHILCNYREADHPNKWLEEAICETASLYALRRMAEAWKRSPPYPNWKSYSSALAKYAADRSKNFQLPEGQTLAAWYARHESTLRKNHVLRDLNGVVAEALLPLFEKEPSGWDAIGHINSFPRGTKLSLEEHLAQWQQAAPPRHKEFVRKFAAILGVKLATSEARRTRV